MNIKQRLDTDLKTALLSGQKDHATTLRGLKSVILNAEIASNNREAGLPEDQITQLFNKEVKKRQESAEMYIQGNSQERADKELVEKDIILAYLPTQLKDEALNQVVVDAIQELQANGIKDMGKVIQRVKDQVASQADNTRIAACVKYQLGQVQ